LSERMPRHPPRRPTASTHARIASHPSPEEEPPHVTIKPDPPPRSPPSSAPCTSSASAARA
jgi:hypothetical protein